MIAYATYTFGMAVREKDGATRRAHLEHAAKRSETARKALIAPVLPAGLAHVWRWFIEELHPCRGAGQMGPAPLTWPDYGEWARCMKRTLAPWEFRLLRLLDNAFFATVRAE